MPKAKLTNTFTNKAKCPKDKTKIVYFDTTDTGFILEVRNTGTKTFYYRYNEARTTHQKKLSSTDSISANEARTIIQNIKRDKTFNTPITLQSQLQESTNTTITLEEFFYTHYKPYVELHTKSSVFNIRTFRLHILPSLGKYKLDEITSPMISKAHLELVNIKKLANGTANKLIKFLRHAYNLAIELNLITTNPVKKLKELEETKRERYLNNTETKLLLQAIKQSHNPLLQYIIPFLILTGARKMEVLSAQWKDIDTNKLIWTIPITKNKKPRHIPISNELLSLIQSIPKTSKYLFTSPVDNKTHIQDIYRAWNTARKKVNLQSLRIHDLRHSFASTLVNNGTSLYEVQTLLGHSSIQMTQRYAHLSNESLMKAVSCAGKLME